MPLIKARDAESKIARAEVLRLQDVEAEAERILAEARSQADAILAESKVRAERARSDAHKAGLENGRNDGLRIGQELGRKQALEQATADFAAKHATAAKALAAALEEFETRRRALQSQTGAGRGCAGRGDRQSRRQAGGRCRSGVRGRQLA